MSDNFRFVVETNAPELQKRSSLVKFVVALFLMIAILAVITAFMLPAVRVAREPARRSQCKNNLKQIALALMQYESDYHALPPAYTVDDNGNRLHSWRTLILPYLDQKNLYDKIDLTKPWDDPVNAEALKSSVYGVYTCPSGTYPPARMNHTTYLAVVTSESCFRATEPRLLSEITDKHSETLLVLEVDAEHSVPWMAPRDADEALFLGIGPKSKLDHTGVTHAAFVDGKVKAIKADLPATVRHALISIAGNEPVSED